MYSVLAWILRFVFIAIIYYFLYNILRLLFIDINHDKYKIDKRNVVTQATLFNKKSGEEYKIFNVTTIGRADDCDIVLKDEFVSSKHAQIYRDGPYYYIEDLKSTNGTNVNKHRINRPTKLRKGDNIAIGTKNFVFDAGDK